MGNIINILLLYLFIIYDLGIVLYCWIIYLVKLYYWERFLCRVLEIFFLGGGGGVWWIISFVWWFKVY